MYAGQLPYEALACRYACVHGVSVAFVSALCGTECPTHLLRTTPQSSVTCRTGMPSRLFDNEAVLWSLARYVCVRARLTKNTSHLVSLISVSMLVVVVVHSAAKSRELCPCRDLPAPCVTGRPCTYPDVVDLRVVVITFNRADSLLKLLRSLDTLVLDADRAALEIWIDRDRNGGDVDQRTLDVASSFSWERGLTRVHVQVPRRLSP